MYTYKQIILLVHASLRSGVQLQQHQEEGVQRMITMERSYRGGILADEVKILVFFMEQTKIILYY